MSKLNKANNTSIFFDEILANFRPFILLVLDCSYKKPYILPPKVFILWRYFFTHVIQLTPSKLTKFVRKVMVFFYPCYSITNFNKRKIQGLKILLQLFNN